MEKSQPLSATQKALALNLDRNIYGTFSEIGGGQEVARHFFQAGAASGTIAKTMSAYDMQISDSIYGKEDGGRYVSESRLHKILDQEFDLLQERLKEARSKDTRFFVFGDTVATSSFRSTQEGQGWLGIKFQMRPGGEPNKIILHTSLLGHDGLIQQNVLGTLGVNLIYSAFQAEEHPVEAFRSLFDHINWGQIEVNHIYFSGPDFKTVDNRLMALRLIKYGRSKAVLFDPKGRVISPRDALYKKNILAMRANYRPVTNLHLNMIQGALEQFKSHRGVEDDNTIVLSEITMNKLLEAGGEIDVKDFLARYFQVNILLLSLYPF